MNVDLYCQLCKQIIQNVERGCFHFATALHHEQSLINVVCPYCNSNAGVTLMCYVPNPVDPYAGAGFCSLPIPGKTTVIAESKGGE